VPAHSHGHAQKLVPRSSKQGAQHFLGVLEQEEVPGVGQDMKRR
jgi:hypothetical protein